MARSYVVEEPFHDGPRSRCRDLVLELSGRSRRPDGNVDGDTLGGSDYHVDDLQQSKGQRADF